MKNKYDEIKEKHQQRVNNFPMIFAFSQEHLYEGMKKLGLKSTDTDKIYDMGMGCFIKKIDIDDYNKMWSEIRKEHNDLINADKTGEGYIKDMFISELENHEYSYTLDIDETLDALELTREQVNNSPTLKHGLYLARKEILSKEETIEEDYEL